MITIHREESVYYDGIREVNILAFGRENEARLVDTLRGSDDFIRELSLVAIRDGEVVGHILFSPIKIQTQQGDIPALALAPMAVLPELQNQGIGSELVKHGLKECKQLGHKVVVVVGHPGYYPRFGFSSARAKGLKISFQVPDEAFMVLELVTGALDGVSGIVKFPKAFDDV